jgi:hypothetical protein
MVAFPGLLEVTHRSWHKVRCSDVVTSEPAGRDAQRYTMKKGETASRDLSHKVKLSKVGELTLYSCDKISNFINLNIVPNFETNVMQTQSFFAATIKLLYNAFCDLFCACVTSYSRSSLSVWGHGKGLENCGLGQHRGFPAGYWPFMLSGCILSSPQTAPLTCSNMCSVCLSEYFSLVTR